MPNRQTDKENTMALRVPKAALAPGMSEAMIEQFGAVPEPLEATWHSPKVAQAALEFGGKIGEWDVYEHCSHKLDISGCGYKNRCICQTGQKKTCI